MSLVKSRRAVNEFLEAPQISEELKGIEELLKSEAKEKQIEIKKQKGEEANDLVEKEDEEIQEEDEPIKTQCIHMVIAETEKPELPCKKDTSADQIAKLNEKLLNFKKMAQRKASFIVIIINDSMIYFVYLTCFFWNFKLTVIHSYQVAKGIKLIVEPAGENELVDMYMDTFLKDYHGEWLLGWNDHSVVDKLASLWGVITTLDCRRWPETTRPNKLVHKLALLNGPVQRSQSLIVSDRCSEVFASRQANLASWWRASLCWDASSCLWFEESIRSRKSAEGATSTFERFFA